MSWAFQNNATSGVDTSGTATEVRMVTPANALVDIASLLIAIVVPECSGDATDPGPVVAPAGWTQIINDLFDDLNNQKRVAVFYRIASSAEQRHYTFSWANPALGVSYAMLNWDGNATGGGIVSSQNVHKTADFTATKTAPSITVSETGDLLVTIYVMVDSPSITGDGSMTTVFDNATNTSTQPNIYVQDLVLSSSGATGTKTITNTGAQEAYALSVAFLAGTGGSGGPGTGQPAEPAPAFGTDGFSMAPAGVSPQNPTLLDPYNQSATIRALGFKCAGVDFGVGPPAATVFKDWQSLAGLPGVTINTATTPGTLNVRVDAQTDFVIDGYDFTMHNGANLLFGTGAHRGIVRNCKFGGTNYSTLVTNGIIGTDTATQGLTVEYCFLDGGGAGSGACFISNQGGGDISLRYNVFQNFPQRVLENVQNGVTSLDYRFNYITNGAQETGAHLNFCEWSQGNGPNVHIEFNTIYQQPQVSAGECFQFDPALPGMTFTSPEVRYNTFVAGPGLSGLGGPALSYIFHGNLDASFPATLSGLGRLQNNYWDLGTPTSPTGFGPYYTTASFPGAPATSFASGWIVSGNVDMRAGLFVNLDGTTGPIISPPPPYIWAPIAPGQVLKISEVRFDTGVAAVIFDNTEINIPLAQLNPRSVVPGPLVRLHFLPDGTIQMLRPFFREVFDAGLWFQWSADIANLPLV